MRIHEYNQFEISLTFTLATPRPESAPASLIASAHQHEQWAAEARAALREWKHIDPYTLEVPAARRLSTYFPQKNGSPLYALRTLVPAGTLRDINQDVWEDVFRLRYRALLVLLPAALQEDERVAFAFERHLESACRQLFSALGLPTTFIPLDDGTRPGEGTVIDIVAELGEAQGAPGRYEVAVPSAI